MSDELDVVVVGGGWAGCRHIEALVGTGRARVSLVESDSAARAKALTQYPIKRAYVTWQEALRERWDGAVVAIPAHLHLDVGRQFTSRGIPLLLEKPVAVQEEGVGNWIDEIESTGVFVSVGFVLRYHPALLAARDHLGSGQLGRPVELVVRRGAHLPARRADYATSYYSRVEDGGGVVQDILSHAYNSAEWLLGPIEVTAADAEHLVLEGTSVHDTVHVIGRHGSVLASYVVNQHQRVPEFTLDVHCTNGSVRVDFVEGGWLTTGAPDEPWKANSSPSQAADNFSRQAIEFVDGIAGRAMPRCSLRDGAATLRAVRSTLARLNSKS